MKLIKEHIEDGSLSLRVNDAVTLTGVKNVDELTRYSLQDTAAAILNVDSEAVVGDAGVEGLDGINPVHLGDAGEVDARANIGVAEPRGHARVRH